MMEVGHKFSYFANQYTIKNILRIEETFPMTFMIWFSGVNQYGRIDSFRAEYCEGSDTFEWVEEIQKF